VWRDLAATVVLSGNAAHALRRTVRYMTVRYMNEVKFAPAGLVSQLGIATVF
jgi:hypothetical protein